jgi:CHAD domain-containing protein
MSKRLRDARHGELSEKPLHELRIACRRAEAALRLCEDAADSKAWRWLTRSLKSLRRTCNQARDADVLEDWLKRQTTPTGQSLRRVIRHHRRDIEPEIRKLASGLCEHRRFERRSAKLISRLQACEASGQIAASFGRRLFDEVHRFVKSLAVGRDEASKLHRLRIAGKRLRYGSELVTEIWPDVELTELKEHLHSLQDWLGAIQDQVVGERLLKKCATAHSAKVAQTLARKARSSAARQQRKFWTWWRACPLERMLADTTAEVLTLMTKDR